MKNIKIKLLLGILTASTLAINVNALNLSQAVNIALEKNLDIQAKNFDYLESLENIKLNNSNLLPKVGLGFAYNDKDEIAYSTQAQIDATFTAEISYNLFNGFKDISDKNSSRFLSKSSNFSLNALKQDIILNTKITYINYLDKQNALETYNSAYSLFKEQYENSKNRYEQGLIAKNDLLQVQINMSTAKQNITKAKGALKTAKNRLSNLLGGMDLSLEIIEKLNNTTLEVSNYDTKILDNRSEIQALTMNLEAIKQQKKSIKSSFYPKVDAALSHKQYYEDIADYNNQNILSLSASWNLYNGGLDEAKDNIYRTRYLKAKTQLVKTKLDIKLQFENASSNLEVAVENFNTATLSQEQAKENYKIIKNRFNEGVSTSTDLTDANYLLTQAKQNLNRAYFDKFLAISTLDRIFEK